LIADIEVMSVPDFMQNLLASLDLLLCLYLCYRRRKSKHFFKHSPKKLWFWNI